MMMPQARVTAAESAKKVSQRVQEALFSGLGDKAREQPEIEVDARLTMSDREVLQKKDFAQMSAAEVLAAKAAIARLVLPLDEVRTRRLAPMHRGRALDMLQPLPASLKADGTLIVCHTL